MRHNLLSFACIFFAFKSAGLDCLPVASQTRDRLPASIASSNSSQDVDAAYPGTTPLHGLDNGNNVTGSAPGADAMMNQDLLLVNPNKSGAAPQPLQSFIGSSLKMSIDQKNITFHGLRGLMITVFNDTGRPLVIDGDNAKAMAGTQTYTAIPVSVLQKCILPKKGIVADTELVVTQIAPAAASIGVTPTVEDYIKMKKPVRKRYGADSQRRQAEASRFGKRILWPHQKTQGILYFKTDNALTGAKVQIPIHTLFDVPDSAILGSS